MKILFWTDNKTDQLNFYIEMLDQLNQIDNVEFSYYKDDFENYDIILLMSTSLKLPIETIRKCNRNCKIGLVDPRVFDKKYLLFDFALVQGIEQENSISDYFFDIFRYDFHPACTPKTRKHQKNDRIVIGYHGNKVHLHTMFPYLTTALDELSKKFPLEFRAYFNIDQLGLIDLKLFESNIQFKQIQWTRDIFEKDFPEIDIGIVPNLIPIKNPVLAKEKVKSYPFLFNEHSSDYLSRYKATSNIARLYPFAMFGIPVVADLYPSACHSIQSGVTGMFGGSAGMWYRSLHKLIVSPELRQKIGDEIHLTG